MPRIFLNLLHICFFPPGMSMLIHIALMHCFSLWSKEPPLVHYHTGAKAIFISICLDLFVEKVSIGQRQGGRSWQPVGEGQNGHKVFCQARNYYFSHKCVIFVRNCKFANQIQYIMQYVPCDSALLAQETLFLTQKGTFLPKDLQKVCKSRQILIRDNIAYVQA